MAQCGKCLPHKCEDPSSDLQNPLTPASYPLTIHALWHVLVCVHPYTK